MMKVFLDKYRNSMDRKKGSTFFSESSKAIGCTNRTGVFRRLHFALISFVNFLPDFSLVTQLRSDFFYVRNEIQNTLIFYVFFSEPVFFS